MYTIHNHTGIGHSGEITRVRIAPNGKHVISVSADGAIIRWKMPELEQQPNLDTSLEERVEQLAVNEQEKGAGLNISTEEQNVGNGSVENHD